MPRVFIPQSRDELDLTDAKRFGTLVVLNDGGDVYTHAAAAVAEVERGLKDFKPDDHLLLIGDPVMIATAAAVASRHLGFSKRRDSTPYPLRVLKWSREERCYFPLELAVV